MPVRRARVGLSFVLSAWLLLPGCKHSTKTPTPPSPGNAIISSLAGPENADVSLGADQGRVAAVGFTMPGQSYVLESVVLKLRTLHHPQPESLVVRLFDNNAQNNPGSALATSANPLIGTDVNPPQTFAFLPTAPETLAAGTTYWIVVYHAGHDSPGWTSGNPSIVPTGAAAHFGSKFDLFRMPNPPTTDIASIPEYAVTGSPIP